MKNVTKNWKQSINSRMDKYGNDLQNIIDSSCFLHILKYLSISEIRSMMITSKYFTDIILELLHLLPIYEKRVYILGKTIKNEIKYNYICGELNKYSFARNKFQMNNIYIEYASISNLDFNCPIKKLVLYNCYMKNHLLFNSESIEYLSINNCFHLEYLFINTKSFDKLEYFSLIVRHSRFFEEEIFKKVLELLPVTIKKIKLSDNILEFYELNKNLVKNRDVKVEVEKNNIGIINNYVTYY